MPTVLITPESMRDQPAPYVDSLSRAGFEVRYPENPELSRGLTTDEETIAELEGVAAVLAGGELFNRRVMTALPELRVIARVGVGYDRVDVAAATERGIVVTITPTANHEAVAEQTLALLFAVAKRLVVNDQATRAGHWRRTLTRPVRGQTLGILGLGRIGRSMALRGLGVGMKVLATETYPDEEFVAKHGIELVNLETLLASSDYLSIHCPLNDETRGMFNAELFAKMKPNSVLLNTSRGPLVVEADLLRALEEGPLGAAGLDVFEQEPTSPENPLFKLDNVVVSPHIAGTDSRSMEDMGIEAAGCITTLQNGKWPTGAVVNDELRENWKW